MKNNKKKIKGKLENINKKDPLMNFESIVFDNAVSKDENINIQNQQINLNRYFDFLYNGSTTTNQYHADIINQAKKGLVFFMVVFSVVTSFICFMVGYVIITGNNNLEQTLTLLASALSEFLSAYMVTTMENLMKSRDKFFMESINSDKLSKMIGFVQNMSKEDSEAKNKMIEKLIDDYCENVNNNTNTTNTSSNNNANDTQK